MQMFIFLLFLLFSETCMIIKKGLLVFCAEKCVKYRPKKDYFPHTISVLIYLYLFIPFELS